jgi:hypothetical protein
VARKKTKLTFTRTLKATDGRLKKNRQKRIKLASPEATRRGYKVLPSSGDLNKDLGLALNTVEDKTFDATAERIAKAVLELNTAMSEAAKHQEMRAELFPTEEPGQLAYRIYRMTHALYTWQIRTDVEPIEGKSDFWLGQYKAPDKPLASATITARAPRIGVPARV